MRSNAVLATVFLTAGILVPGIASAQGNPSAEQIIKSLTPTGPSDATRGLRLKPAVQGQARPRPPQEESAVSLTVQFATGSAELTPEAVHTLDDLGKALSSHTLASYRFRIEGHTDTVGARQSNLELSDRRATAVLDYLAENFAVDRSRLRAIGMGENGLLIPTPDQTPEPRNRRVQVVNIGS